MTDDAAGVTESNFERLQRYLVTESLAGRLVAAYVDAAPVAKAAALSTIVSNRLIEIASTHDED